MGFKILSNEDNENTESLNMGDQDTMEMLLATEELDARIIMDKIKMDVISVQLAEESLERLDALISKDKQAIENNNVDLGYVNYSTESFHSILSTLGLDVEIISTENHSDLPPLDLLKLSLEEKEAKKKSIIEKIKSKIKSIGEAFKNFGKLIAIAFKNNLKLINELKSRIKLSGNAKSDEVTSSMRNTVTRLTSQLLPFEDIKKIGNSDIVKLVEDMVVVALQDSSIVNGITNLNEIIKKDYDYDKIKLTKFNSESKLLNKEYSEIVPKMNVEENKILAVHFEYNGIFGMNVRYLYATGKKPGLFTSGTSMGLAKIKKTRFDHKSVEVELFDKKTLLKILDVSEDSVKRSKELLGKLVKFYNIGSDIGDASPGIFAQNMWEYVNQQSTFFNKGVLHMVNVMLAQYENK